MKRFKVARIGLLCLLSLCSWLAVGHAAPPRPKSVRIIYLVSADRNVRDDFRKGIETAANDLQGWYGKQLGGPTFRLNDPVVEVAKSDKDAKWFYSHPNGVDKDDWGFNNGLAEAQRLVGARQGDPDYVWVIYSDGHGNKGQGGDGVAVLPEDDLLGLVGQHPEQKDVKRWIAGLGHELGHAFGLAHPRDPQKDADAIMCMGIYGKYPDKTYLTEEDKGILMKSQFFFPPNAEEGTGLAALTGKDTPLKRGTTIAFFGDSITMQGGYIETMRKALATSPQTKDLRVKLLQHGLNGGRVPTVLEGQSPWGKLGGTMQQLLDKEKPNVVVIFLGVNDVWHKEKGTTPEDFQASLRKMIDLSKAGGAKVVLATLATIGEKPDGSNPFDKKLDQYAELTRDVARQTGVTLVDLRKEFLAYLKQHNAKDANGQYKADKILTYDGVHMLPAGNDLLADRISRGVVETLKK